MTATVIALPGRSVPPPRHMTSEERDRALNAELRRARIRIARLERALSDALYEAAALCRRARTAERRLADVMESGPAARLVPPRGLEPLFPP